MWAPVWVAYLLNSKTLEIDLIKVDVEGAEQLVLKRAETIGGRIKTWVIEIRDLGKKRDIVKYLCLRGYKVMELDYNHILALRKLKTRGGLKVKAHIYNGMGNKIERCFQPASNRGSSWGCCKAIWSVSPSLLVEFCELFDRDWMLIKPLLSPKAGIDRSRADDNSFKQHTLRAPNRVQVIEYVYVLRHYLIALNTSCTR